MVLVAPIELNVNRVLERIAMAVRMQEKLSFVQNVSLKPNMRFCSDAKIDQCPVKMYDGIVCTKRKKGAEERCETRELQYPDIES